ncbi:MAG TPA: quinoprotein dehydrogenase-associated SoxYZ-like carrier [Geminicoccaceae bacterium]|nr:quinoprotein dehydrogenase-associated SoxYZ-like carrier [Geminicoccaceae bacterium]
MVDRRSFLALSVAAVGAGGLAPSAWANEGPWPAIRAYLFADREINDGAGVLALEAPKRAHDAAVVPVTIQALMPQTPERYIRTVHLIVDVNPAPIAGVFRFYPETGDATLATRLRVNAYTPVRAIAETSDGQLYMVERFVKASGGCSAPAMKDHEQAMARLGQMKLKQTAPFVPGVPNQAQLLISHPNYTGLQIDQLSRHWIPPDYINRIEVRYGDRPVLTVEGDISLSEDPSLTFSFVPDQPGALRVSVEDTKGRHFEEDFTIGPGQSS